MPRYVVRERTTATGGVATAALVALALGAAAGWLLGEFWEVPTAPDAPRGGRSGPRSMAELVGKAQEALLAEPSLAELALEILPVSRQRVELHGWVPSRRLRATAQRVAATAVGADAVINCILVRGEDDGPDPVPLDILSA